MHELATAQDVLSIVQREALVYNAVRVKAIRLRMGVHSHLEPRSLSFCLESIAQDTILEGARVEIVPCEADVECAVCGRFPYDGDAGAEVRCPKCGETAKRMPPTEIYIQEITLDVEDDPIGKESSV
ncbi:MAG: hydrogenase maturation nickel metallochaperone HypA [Candidatus Omnitrophica bacterium]|nr:hydrogenase maturation nickel metallochaperone HypA [Candidatus Omnitrophota bacterium]